MSLVFGVYTGQTKNFYLVSCFAKYFRLNFFFHTAENSSRKSQEIVVPRDGRGDKRLHAADVGRVRTHNDNRSGYCLTITSYPGLQVYTHTSRTKSPRLVRIRFERYEWRRRN